MPAELRRAARQAVKLRDFSYHRVQTPAPPPGADLHDRLLCIRSFCVRLSSIEL